LGFSGTLSLPEGPSSITLGGVYSDGLIAPASFDYLVDVLFRGAPAHPESAVFEVFGSQLSIAFIFQLGGTRGVGSRLLC
jgi:hypothetical protein